MVKEVLNEIISISNYIFLPIKKKLSRFLNVDYELIIYSPLNL
jgi:hypothetical protein